MSGKKFIAILASAFALSLSFLLFGCFGGEGSGSSSSKSETDEAMEAFSGTWDLAGITKGDASVDDAELAKLDSSAEGVFVNLNKDGTAEFQLVTLVRKGTWKASDATSGTVTLMGDTADMKIEENKLRFKQSGYELTFAKSSKARTVTDYVRSQKIDNMLIADDGWAKIELTEKRVDEDADPGYVFKVENKSQQPIYFTPKPGTFKVDGVVFEPYGAYTVGPGEKIDAFVWFDHHELGSSDLDALKNVIGTMELWDNKTYDVLATYEVNL